MVADVVVENASYSFDIPFSYRVPGRMEGQIRPGCRVLVPFGRSNRSKQGLVLRLQPQDPQSQQLKPIKMLLDQKPLLGEEQLWLLELLHQRTFCTYYEGLRALVPSGLTFRLKLMCSLGEARPQQPTDKQRQLLDYLSAKKKPVELEHLLEQLELERGEADFEQLLEEGAILLTEQATEKIADSKEVMVRKSEDCEQKLEGVRLTPARKKVLALLEQTPCASLKELCYYAGTTRQTLDKMEKAGLLCYYGRQVFRSPYADREEENPTPVTLNPSQQQALDGLWEQWQRGEGSALLYGVTGSGKSQVYLKLAEQVRAQGKRVIILVPEISLTPQTVRLFRSRFGQRVAVLHSGLTMAERADEYRRIQQGLADVVVGTRSAVFAPLEKIGLIVIDEEQEGAYASQQSPRYHARDIARARCHRHQALLLLASATPSVETFYQAQRGRIRLYTLTHRYLGNQLPKVQIVDSTQSYGFDISQELTAELLDNLKAGQQSILLLNRRGYHTAVRCNNCQEVVKCPNCSVALTYHSANHRLMCHYCGYSVPYSRHCPSCGSDTVTFRGAGTQKAEEQLQALLPEARVLRVDTDSVAAKYSLEKKLDQFAKGEYDVMVGTQMVAKGLDFENVTLVGVLSADQSLYSDDFRSNERTFDLLTQGVGRAGRGKYPGRAIIQTYAPENPVLHLAAQQDYFGFYRQEILFRQAMLYPPFVDILVIGFVGEKESLVKQGANAFLRDLGQLAREEYSDLPLRVLQPSPAAVAKVSNKYRYKLLVKCRNTPRLREMISRLLVQFASQREFQQVTAYADPNPYRIL